MGDEDQECGSLNKSSLKAKKRAPTALTVECGVCHGPAPDHIHFGARCCYSCRAFFRRTAARSEFLTCRSSLRTCEITSSSKKCIACRYDKCLKIGMKPELVQGSRKKTGERIDAEECDTEESLGTDYTGSDNAFHDRTRLQSPHSKPDDNVLNQFHNSSNKFHPNQMTESTAKDKTEEKKKDENQQPTALQLLPDFLRRRDSYNNLSSNSFMDHPYKNKEEPPESDALNKDSDPSPKSLFPLKSFSSPMGSTLSSNQSTCQSKFESHSYPSRSHDFLPNNDPIQMSFFEEYNANNRATSTTGVGYKDKKSEEMDIRRRLSQNLPYARSNQFPLPGTQGSHKPFTEASCHYKTDLISKVRTGSYQRASVIKSLKRASPERLQFEAEILKYQGSILQHTGNLFNYHANLLAREKKQKESESNYGRQDILKHLIKKEEIKPEVDIKDEKRDHNDQQIEAYNKGDLSTELADQMFEEAQELLVNSPWITNISVMNEIDSFASRTEQNARKSPEDKPYFSDQNFNLEKESRDIDKITDLHFSTEELESDVNAIQSGSVPATFGQTSVIQRKRGYFSKGK